MRLAETIKYVAYRTPYLSNSMKPKYPFKVDPGQLAGLVNLIDRTRDVGGAVVEIGVAQGYTSAFLLEHLRATEDEREVLLFDTFSGFTEDSISHEIGVRKQNYMASYGLFRYGDEEIFKRNLSKAGYDKFRTFAGDAAEFDWSTVGPVSVVLLDIDVYKPTRAILDHIWPHLTSPGGIIVDDCLADGPWDGSLQAYEEFISEVGHPFVRVGGKGALVGKGL